MTRTFLPFLCILPALAYSLLSLSAVRAFFRRTPPGEPGRVPVSVVKPLKGLDADSRQNLESFITQNHPRFQIVFALQSEDDPCLPLIRRLMVDYPGHDLSLVVDPAVHGANGKVSNLINAFPLLKHDIIVVADSDIRVPADYLTRVCAYFSTPQVGLVTSLYRGVGLHGAATAVEALGFTVEMMPNVIVAEKLEGLSFSLGAATAVRREALAAIGGFASLADYLADDYQLGNMIHRAGWQVELAGDLVDSVMQEEGLAAILSRQLRWCRTMRVSRPWGYLASGVTLPFPAAAAALLVSGFTPPGLWAVSLLYLLRGGVVTYFSRTFSRDGLLPGYLWLLPLRDLLATATWALSFCGRCVRWRGTTYTLRGDGKMTVRD